MRRPKYLRIGEVNEVNVTVSGLGMECLTLADATGGAPGFPLSPGTVLFTSLHLRGNLGYPLIVLPIPGCGASHIAYPAIAVPTRVQFRGQVHGPCGCMAKP